MTSETRKSSGEYTCPQKTFKTYKVKSYAYTHYQLLDSALYRGKWTASEILCLVNIQEKRDIQRKECKSKVKVSKQELLDNLPRI
ncbi:unnamed protein product [Brugia pahangi]|uniref:Transposase n=1 Tax=Brugia pahangi TaxID=6280 RepID=A0A0N4TSE3_BRUPA|nr:unnamed protein product [Brugia pahangi]